MEPPNLPPLYPSQPRGLARQTGFYPETPRPASLIVSQPVSIIPKRIVPKNIVVTGTEFTFQVGDITLRDAARLRQILMAEIPAMAIDCVEIYENTTILQDEFLAQRIGLIPLTSSNISQLPFSRGCDCHCPGKLLSECMKCSIILNLKIIGKKEGFVNVTSRDIIPENLNYQVKPVEYTIFDGTVPVYILLVRIQMGQELDVRCIAKKGTGAEHAKFSSVAGPVILNKTKTGDFIFSVGMTGALSPKELLSELVLIYSREKLIL